MGEDITVVGGVAGTGVALDDLDAAARRLLLEGARVGGLAPGILSAAVDPAVLLSAFDDPGDLVDLVSGRATALDPAVLALVAEIEAEALRAGGPTGVLGVGASLAALGTRLAVAVTGYRAAEGFAHGLVESLQDDFMTVVGVLTPVVGGVAVGGALGGVDVLDAADRLAFDCPWLVDTASGGVEGYLRGLATFEPFAVVLAAGALRARTSWPPRDERDAIRIIAGVGGLGGALDEDPDHTGVLAEVADERAATGPAGLAGLMADEVDLGRPDDEGRVRVVEVPQSDGSSAWILELPGTQDWGPRAGANPFDLTTDVEAMAGEATLAAAGAASVLATAQRRRGRLGAGDPVMLVGHSQGGILAASLASDPRFRAQQRVTDVVAFGAPVSRFPVPPEIRVLSVEHRQDPVPRLDGGASPDRAGWVTVERDLAGRPGLERAGATHRAALYLPTARLVDGMIADGSADPSLLQWHEDTSRYFGADARVTEARLARLPRGSP